MKIIESTWFHCQMDTIGIVIAENEVGERKAYIGCGKGIDEKLDEQDITSNKTRNILALNHQRISSWGSKITSGLLRRIADNIDKKDL